MPLADVLAPDVADLIDRLEGYARAAAGAFADNTIRALGADSRTFAAWCRANSLSFLPAAPGTVADFIDAQAAIKAPATVARYRSSIAALHRAAGVANPCLDEVVRLAIRRMNRAYGTRQRQAEPLNRPSIDRMLTKKTPDRQHRRIAEAGRPVPLIALRNAALLAIAYDTLLRRSELVALLAEDLQRAEDGSGTILVRRSKGDQEAAGAVKYLAPDTVGHARAWLIGAGVSHGPLFRPITKGGRPGAGALGSQEVRRLFRDVAAAAGVKLARTPSGHSTRVGAAQDMIAAGLELGEVMQAGSWKTVTMPARYSERLLARRGAARKLATFQNRA